MNDSVNKVKRLASSLSQKTVQIVRQEYIIDGGKWWTFKNNAPHKQLPLSDVIDLIANTNKLGEIFIVAKNQDSARTFAKIWSIPARKYYFVDGVEMVKGKIIKTAVIIQGAQVRDDLNKIVDILRGCGTAVYNG